MADPAAYSLSGMHSRRYEHYFLAYILIALELKIFICDGENRDIKVSQTLAQRLLTESYIGSDSQFVNSLNQFRVWVGRQRSELHYILVESEPVRELQLVIVTGDGPAAARSLVLFV